MKRTYTWDEYRAYLESVLEKNFVDFYYEELFSKEKWEVFVWRYKCLVLPIMVKLIPNIDHHTIWEKTADNFTKELILYHWGVSKYCSNSKEPYAYKDEDIKCLVHDVLIAEGIKCKEVKI